MQGWLKSFGSWPKRTSHFEETSKWQSRAKPGADISQESVEQMKPTSDIEQLPVSPLFETLHRPS
jgi:hypothetical protein